MPFVVELKDGGLPVGVYAAEFVRAEDFESEDRPDLPPAYKLVWRVLNGPHKGVEATRIVSRKTGPKANLPKFLKMLTGREVQAGEKIDLETLYGTRGSVVMEETEGGGRALARSCGSHRPRTTMRASPDFAGNRPLGVAASGGLPCHHEMELRFQW